MAKVAVLLPQYGMGMQDGEIIQWLKNVGDSVTAGEPLVEVEAAKTTVEVPSPETGVLVEINAEPGETVDVRGVIAHIEVAG